MSGREKPLILQNGMPIPQEYDKDLGDWTEYSNEHIKAIKAELALVKAELQTIKTNQLSGDQKVQLSGNIVTSEVLFPRQIRQQGETNRILRTPPAGAKGFAIKHIIYGVTGNFSSEQGSKLLVETRGVNDASGTYALFGVPINQTYTLGHHQVVVVYPGVAPDGLAIVSGRQFKVISIPASLFNWIFFIQTSGTFTAEQGVDSEVVLQWIA